MQSQPNYPSQLLAFHLPEECPVRLTLMEHLPGNEITFLHWHNCFELALCLDGTGIFIIGSEGIHSVSRDDV